MSKIVSEKRHYSPVKYRAWSKGDLEMNSVTALRWSPWFQFITAVEVSSVGECSLDDVILMQSTGIKDQHEKEVFESDVVAFQTEVYVDEVWGKPLYETYSDYAIVKWIDGRFILHLYDEDLELWEVCEDGKMYGLVVGNIYENPELLKYFDEEARK